MTKTPKEEPLWSMMPGWGIVADLTPPELINSRQLQVVRKLILTGLVGVLVLCLTGFVFAKRHESAAAEKLEMQQATRVAIQQDARQYAGITMLQGTVSEIEKQIATLMASDVQLGALIGQLRSRLPARMSISQVAVTISAAGAAGTGAAAASGGLDTSGNKTIGNVTINGAAQNLVDVSTYVDRLAGIQGIANVVPLSSTVGKDGVQFSLALNLTDRLLSHRFDQPGKGGN